MPDAHELPPRVELPIVRPVHVPWWRRVGRSLRDFFVGEPLTFTVALVPLTFLSMLLFTRHPLHTNFIFDEQEALLANPYVRSAADPHTAVRWRDAFYLDFWGLPADRSIGSYRPLPDLVWRALWKIGARDQTPFLHHWVNVLLHGVNGAIVALMVQRLTRDRVASWIAGATFVGCAVLTEAVSGVVGIADVMSATGVLLAFAALCLRAELMMPAVFAATLFGLYSKESALCVVPLLPAAAWLLATALHPSSPRRWARMTLAGLASSAAFVLYVEARRRMFPAPLSHELSDESIAATHGLHRVFLLLLKWYAQPALPRDPLNNPLVNADVPHRIAGALRVYARGLGQVIFPKTLSGDYSAPQEPIPDRLIFPGSVIGALAMVGPIVACKWLGIRSWLSDMREAKRDRSRSDTTILTAPDLRPLIAIALLGVVIAYFPVSNIPVVLPTVRAERFWYFPAIGTSILLALVFARVLEKLRRRRKAWIVWTVWTLFFAFQCFAARRHANDYENDLVFWDATRRAVPNSAKAHLNYSVMQGARGRLDIRLESNEDALKLAPDWPMANVYLGDTLCRMHRPIEAWPAYEKGFALSPNDTPLLALGIQCLWDEHALDEGSSVRDELDELADKHEGSWLAFIARDVLENGAEHGGVDPKYRPRGYNQGPKDP